jgi:type IV secretion system protein TrbG
MKVVSIAFLVGMGLSLPCHALNTADQMADEWFSTKQLPLTQQEKQALAISHKWQTGDLTSKPFYSEDGSVSFVFGSGQPKVLCAVLQVCDIALEQGEILAGDPQIGDPRFQVDTVLSGGQGEQRAHLLVKPKDVGLDTSLVVPTNRRVYHINLRSSRHKYMPYVTFTYANNAKVDWAAMQKAQLLAERQQDTLPVTGEYLKNLSFEYNIDGVAAWKPTRVFNDGKKTIIEMPSSVTQSDAPALLVLKDEGGFFSDDRTAIVNYRMQGGRYIVDSVFQKAILVAGVGDAQEKVTIIKGGGQ